MSLEVVKGLLTLKLTLVSTVAAAALLLLFGAWILKVLPVVAKLCIPAAVIGGFTFSLLAWLLRSTNMLDFSLDTSLQTPLMLMFFTTVGLKGSFALMKKGGKALVIYLVGCWVLAIMQAVIGVSTALATGIQPVLGVMAGTVSLEGGHGAAAAFGPTAESMGVQGALVVAIAAATFGLISGGLLGGPIGRWLIEKNKLKISSADDDIDYASELEKEKKPSPVTPRTVLLMFTLIAVIMVIGDLITGKIQQATGFLLPGYISAMAVAIIFRNINDATKTVKLEAETIDIITDFSLGLFLSMAMMSLKIWQLSSLALPLIIILAVQTIFIIAYSIYIMFPALGKNYDAAVMCAGMVGHGLGATPTAMANMEAVTKRYKKRSDKAFLIVPLCGAVLIDFVGIPTIVWTINFFAKWR